MFEKSVPGFCTELQEAVKMFDIKDGFKKTKKVESRVKKLN